jgi:hypothetical protein
MKPEYQEIIHDAETNRIQLEKQFVTWKKKKPKTLDGDFQSEHIKAFKKIDCLKCANCCKTTSPIFRDIDIKRISKSLRIKEVAFIDQFLRMDEESDYVLKVAPCYFLNPDNTCSIYEIRPLACREYPHTNRKNMFQILDLTLKNTEICPAVAQITNELLKKQ